MNSGRSLGSGRIVAEAPRGVNGDLTERQLPAAILSAGQRRIPLTSLDLAGFSGLLRLVPELQPVRAARRRPMEMFLMAAVMSVMGVAVCAMLFAAATRGEGAPVQPPAEPVERAPQRFFAAAPGTRAQAQQAPRPPAEVVPIEALLLQIEQHVRLEQAAAESFISLPSPEVLNCRTESPLVH
jgi:hypothetical protein